MTGVAIPGVEVSDLVIDRGDVRAVDRISFSARVGEVTVLLGPNGAGKTTTVEHLEGYIPRAGGAASVLGLDPIRDHTALTSRVGVMLQSGGIQTGVRPAELLAQYSSFFPDPLDATELLGAVGLADRARTAFRRLSGGERQRLSLALALIGRPELVFLDEPTAGMDLGGRDLVRNLVRSLASQGTTVVMTTHDLTEAELLADNVVIIDHGRIVGVGSPDELIAAHDSDDLRFAAAADLDVAALSDAIGAKVTEPTPGEYVVALSPSPATVAAVTAWLAQHDHPLADLRAGRQRLEDVFRRLTSEQTGDGGRQ